MIDISVRVLGLRRLQRTFARAKRGLLGATRSNLEKASLVLVGAAQKQFEGERTRARYKISGGERVERDNPRPVTSPPDRLGVFTGNYRNRITFDIKKSGRKLTAEVGPAGVPYARRHELGIRTPERQVLTPAVKESADEIFRILGTSFEVLR